MAEEASSAAAAHNQQASAASSSGQDESQEFVPDHLRLLPFQHPIFSQFMSETDALLVLARGLGVERILFNLLRLHATDTGLVLVINHSNSDACLTLLDDLIFLCSPHVHVITNEVSVGDRKLQYLRGGIQFVTSRILVVDMLTGRLPLELVSGLLVLEAHRVIPTSAEAFILRLFRHGNRTGWIKAVSAHCEGFVGGFNQVEKVLKSLWLKKLFIWPRFHKTIMSHLKPCEPDVFEVKVPMTANMRNIQMAIGSIMTSCLKELQKLRPDLDMKQLTVERGLFHSFDQYLRRQLDPVWHVLGAKTKQLVKDMRTLRTMVTYLDQYDCVSFFHYLETLRRSDYAFNENSFWLFLDATDDLFTLAKRRVMRAKETDETEEGSSKAKAASSSKEPDDVDLEVPPKWEALSQVLDEVEELRETRPDLLGRTGRCMICVRDGRTATQLTHFLEHGAQAVLRAQYKRFQRWRGDLKKLGNSAINAAPASFRRKRKKGALIREQLRAKRIKQHFQPLDVTDATASGASAASTEASMKKKSSSRHGGVSGPDPKRPHSEGSAEDMRSESQKDSEALEEDGGSSSSDDASQNSDDDGSILAANEDDFDASQQAAHDVTMLKSPDEELREHFKPMAQGLYAMYPLQGTEGTVSLSRFSRALEDVQPRVVVFYDPDLGCSRVVETFRAAHPVLPLAVYFMVYESAFQEQRYLSSIRHEKEAFQYVIHSKRVMAVPEDQDGRSGLRQESERQIKSKMQEAEEVVNTRKAGGQSASSAQPRPKVIVDMREFRSTLPSIIHEFGMDIEPVTLEVGDYVLTPHICVERKSLPDLIGSLNSGRLYSQAQAMCRHYRKPCLLIEFEEGKPFSLLASKESLGQDIEYKSTMAKLSLLLLTFPQLRLLWSQSAHATADIFFDLKRHQPEPSRDSAAAIGMGDDPAREDSSVEGPVFAQGPESFLKTLPGINDHNIRKVMRSCTNLQELLAKPLKDLQDLIGPIQGAKLFNFVNNVPGQQAKKNLSEASAAEQQDVGTAASTT